jgi:hypothetical protein
MHVLMDVERIVETSLVFAFDGWEPCAFHFFIFNLSFPVSSSRVGVSTGFPILTLPSEILVGCLRVTEPILSPHLDKLITHKRGN